MIQSYDNALSSLLVLPGLRLQILCLMCILLAVLGMLLRRLKANILLAKTGCSTCMRTRLMRITQKLVNLGCQDIQMKLSLPVLDVFYYNKKIFVTCSVLGLTLHARTHRSFRRS